MDLFVISSFIESFCSLDIVLENVYIVLDGIDLFVISLFIESFYSVDIVVENVK